MPLDKNCNKSSTKESTVELREPMLPTFLYGPLFSVINARFCSSCASVAATDGSSRDDFERHATAGSGVGDARDSTVSTVSTVTYGPIFRVLGAPIYYTSTPVSDIDRSDVSAELRRLVATAGLDDDSTESRDSAAVTDGLDDSASSRDSIVATDGSNITKPRARFWGGDRP